MHVSNNEGLFPRSITPELFGQLSILSYYLFPSILQSTSFLKCIKGPFFSNFFTIVSIKWFFNQSWIYSACLRAFPSEHHWLVVYNSKLYDPISYNSDILFLLCLFLIYSDCFFHRLHVQVKYLLLFLLKQFTFLLLVMLQSFPPSFVKVSNSR